MAKSVWTIDPTHSEVGFKVKHMMFTNISGKFNAFQATVENDGDAFETFDIFFSADVSSIDTNNFDRDNHLKSTDFFDVEKFPTISFKSTSIKKMHEGAFQLIGDLTIKGVTKSVTFDAAYSGLIIDPWDNTKAGVSLSGKINRKEFDLTWNTTLETGGVLVGEDIKLVAEVELLKQ